MTLQQDISSDWPSLYWWFNQRESQRGHGLLAWNGNGLVSRLSARFGVKKSGGESSEVPLYEELMRIARGRLRGEGNVSLEPSDLVHEAFLRLANVELSWRDRTHFLSMAARTMRRVLIDRARANQAEKRGGRQVLLTLSGDQLPGGDEFEVLALNNALDRLAAQDARLGQVMELHYFGGLSYDEIAEVIGGSTATVGRDLRIGRAWMRREMLAQTASS